MMKKYIFPISLFVLFVFLFLFSGCEKDADNIKLPTADPKLVVGCFISPQQDTIQATVTLSNPIFGPNHNKSVFSDTVKDAAIIISDNATSATIPFNAAVGKYELVSSFFPIIPGKTYYLSITTPDGKNVTSSCTVPLSNLSTASIELDSVKQEYYNYSGLDYYNYYIDIKWNDIAGEVNYYKTYAETEYEYPPQYSYPSYYNNLYSYDNEVVKDDMKATTYSAKYYTGYQDYASIKEYIYHAYIMNIDENYYNYQKSISVYQYDDPFTEPTQTFSNIKGGLGVFGAYQLLKITKQF